jgi:cytochrome P450/NADPH-cytochrome P450 reductase
VVPGGYFVRKGSQVTTALHAVMVNKEHWDDPFKFDVGQWGTEKVQHRHSHAYIPFAAGGRGCIGQSLALAEVKVILARWVLNFRFENVTGESVVYDPDFSLFRPLNLKIRVHAQEDAATFQATREAAAPEPSGAKESPTTKRPPVGRTDLPAFYAVHASNTGTCKGFASELTRRARDLGFADVKLLSMEEGPLVDADATAELVAKDHILVVVTCTYNGEPPEAAIDLDTLLDQAVKDKDEHRFAGLRYAVFGCGNKQWGSTYQAFPDKVNASLKALGAEQWFEKGSGNADEDQDRDWNEWSTKLWGQVAAKNGIDLANPQGGQSESSTSSSVSDAVRIAFQPIDDGAKPPRATPLRDFAEASVVENRELVDEGADPPRGMRLLTLSLPPGASYRAGDHVEIVPENHPEAVETVLAKLHLVEQARFSVEVQQEDSLNAFSLAGRLASLGAMDIREALTFHADLSAPLQRSALQHVSTLLPDGDKAKAELEALADPSADKDTMAAFARKNRNFAALLAHNPSVGSALTLKDLLLCVKSIATRRYSIASSPAADSNTLKICVGVNPLITEEGAIEGLCSGFLKSCEPGHKVRASCAAAHNMALTPCRSSSARGRRRRPSTCRPRPTCP